MRIFSLSMLMLALCAACGSSPEPAPEPAVEAPRPGSHGCSACVIRACYAAETPNRLQRVDLEFNPTMDGTPIKRNWKGATLELKPKTGTAQAVELPIRAWKDGSKKSSLKEPKMKPAPGGWGEVSAVLTVSWEKDGKAQAHKFTSADGNITVSVEPCK